MGQISIVAMQNSSPKVTECFNVESRILCMAYIPVEQPQENDEKIPENNHVPAAKASDTPSVCLGMEDGRYSTKNPTNATNIYIYILAILYQWIHFL